MAPIAIELPRCARIAARVTATAMLCVAFSGVAGAASPGRSAKAPIDPAASVVTTGEKKTGPLTDSDAIFGAVVKVETRAVPEARSAATLGMEREGNGVVIGSGGLILTIGYLIVEADDVKITDSRGRTFPARLVGYDHPTGLGLIRTIAPLDVTPVTLGDASKLAERDPVMIVNYEGADDITLAYVVSRRPFTASWEYMLDQAIFTSPPARNWSGAALVDEQGRLLGIGSLVVREAIGNNHPFPGNMFVPIDALKPVLDDLVKTGRRAGAARPWLGVSADEQQGRLMVSRVSPDGPGDKAGIQVGDIILGVGTDGVRSQAEFYRKVWGRGAAGTDIPLRVLQGIDVKELSVHSIDRVEYFRPQTTF